MSAIEFLNVDYIYQADTPMAAWAIKDFSLKLETGSFTAIVGHTGSGKSTLMAMLDGLLVPTHGQLRVGEVVIDNRADKNLWTENPKGDQISYYRGQTENDEARYVVAKIQEEMAKPNRNYGSFAILYRCGCHLKHIHHSAAAKPAFCTMRHDFNQLYVFIFFTMLKESIINWRPKLI